MTKAYVIYLPDHKRSKQVAKRCTLSAKTYGIDVLGWPGITPDEDPLDLMKEEGIPTEPFKERWSRYDNVMACFLSQYYLWMHCVQINENILIFEHDAVVRGEIPLDIPFKGVLTFGHPSYGNFQTPSFIGVNKLVSKQHFPGNHCYLIKPAAAEVLIETAKRDPAPADVFLHNNRFDFLEEYYPWPVYAVDTFSTVQNRNGIQAKHQYQKLGQEYKLL